LRRAKLIDRPSDNHVIRRGRMMEEKENIDPEEKDIKKKNEAVEPDPFCTTAPSAEHARGELEDDPCDDSRDGN
jgi:hypothetical protein